MLKMTIFYHCDSDIQHTPDMGNVDSCFNYCSIEQLGFSKERQNSDLSRVDNHGKRLLELCKSCDLYIANGRLGLDKSLGCKSYRKAMNRNWCNQKAKPALKTKTGNK